MDGAILDMGPFSLRDKGPIIDTQVTKIPLDYKGDAAQISFPDTKYPCLIDTGASHSAINNSLAARLELHIDRPISLNSVNHEGLTVLYSAAIHIPQLAWCRTIQLVGLPREHPAVVLIGRDILSVMEIMYNGANGVVTLKLSETKRISIR